MGLFSKIKKGLSKAWKGVKKAVKKVARGVKKVAKKIAYATPIGKKLWDFSSKVGKGIMKGIGKITSKLGPIGTMALSFVLAPVMGPAIGALWSGFGAGAAAMAASANAFVSTLGSVGSSIFAAGNFVSGTLGALGTAVTEGAKNVMAGNFSAAASSFATNVTSAFTGQAGMSAVHAGAAQAASTAASNVASGESWFAAEGSVANKAQYDALQQSAASSLDKLGAINPHMAGQVAKETGQLLETPEAMQAKIDAGMNPNGVPDKLPEFNTDFDVANLEGTQFDPNQFNKMPELQMQPDGSFQWTQPKDLMTTQAETGMFGKPIDQMTLTDQDAYLRFGAEGVQGANSAVPAPQVDMGETIKRAQQVSDMMGGGQQQGGYQPYMAQPIKSAQVAGAGGVAGSGSAGFSLLGGVRGLEESLRNSQRMMFG